MWRSKLRSLLSACCARDLVNVRPPPGQPDVVAPAVIDESPSYHAHLGDRARDEGRWAEAAEQYARALEFRPVWPEIRVQYGHALKESGRVAEAEEAYRRASLEAPHVADTYLQLGHALKLQGRLIEAEAAYLAALARDADAQHARLELRTLGTAPLVVERYLEAFRREHMHAETMERVSKPLPREAVVERPVTPTEGRIIELTATTIRGELWNLDPRVTPVVVCRRGDETLAVAILDDVTQRGPLPLDHRDFEIVLPESVDDILSVTIEPEGRHLVGSPLILPGHATGALLNRIAAIEAQLGRGGLEAAFERRLERRLVADVAAGVSSHVERVLNRQRTIFERQLVAARQGAFTIDAPTTGALLPDEARPVRVALGAEEGFGGLGWSLPEADGSACRRWMGRVAFVTAELASGSAILMRATISSVASQHILRGLRVAVDGAYAPSWIEPAMEDPAVWIWTALLPPLAAAADGLARIAFYADDAVANGGGLKRSSVALRQIELAVAPRADTPDFRLDGGYFWFAKGWARSETTARPSLRTTLILLPAIEAPAEARLALAGSGLEAISMVSFNGAALPVVAATSSFLELVVAAGLWRTGGLSDLTISWSPQFDSTTAVLTSVVSRSATTLA